MSTDLTPLDHNRLAACEETIRAGLTTFVDVGSALATIRKERLYRAEFGTFEDYCKSKWGMAHRHANRLIEAANIAEELGPVGPKPESERHVRPLSILPPEQRADAWREATEAAPAGRVTAAHVQSVVDRRTGKGEAETTTEYVDMSTGEVLDDVQVVKTTTKRVSRDEESDSSRPTSRPRNICTVAFEHDAEAAADAMLKQFAPKFLRAMCACITERLETSAKETR
jgi:hypothetical protein